MEKWSIVGLLIFFIALFSAIGTYVSTLEIVDVGNEGIEHARNLEGVEIGLSIAEMTLLFVGIAFGSAITMLVVAFLKKNS